jgi:hypothetical protein
MKLNIIRQEQDLEALKIFVELHFKCEMKFFSEQMSIFPQYSMRPKERKFIKEIWKYRIVYQNSVYSFGYLED